MDTSKTYIKMWLASGLEIEPDEYQPWVCPRCFKVYSFKTMPLRNWHWCSHQAKGYEAVKLIPLPRQDQLWNMQPRFADLHVRGSNCWVTVWCQGEGTDFHAPTPEQALIQGVRYELHSKLWIDEKWQDGEK